MYYQYFGLAESPFSISVNPRYLFMSPRHREALAHLLYGVGSGGGFILLTGEVGTGKTTINRALLEQLPDNVDLAIVLNPALSALELLASVCDELEIDYPKAGDSLKQLTDAVHRFLLANHEAGRRTVLMIDEAQHLDFEVLEQIRLLTNLETDHEKLLQIILIGQPELTAKLARPELRQLNQRITARYDLQPLNPRETAAYIRHRLEVAGLPGGQELFPPGVVRAIHKRAQGIPRQINLLCDRALMGAYGRKLTKVTRPMVLAAAKEVFGVDEPAGRLGPRWLLLLTLPLVAALLLWLWPVIEQDRGFSKQPESAAAGGAAPVATVTAPNAPVSNWLLDTATAEQQFWQLASDAPIPPVVCAAVAVSGLQCSRGASEVWEPVIALNRPVLLDMQTPDRFTAATLVVAFDPPAAWVWAQGGIERVNLVELAGAWRGGYSLLWLPPLGWRGPLSVGDSSPAVAEVARLFAGLDGQPEPLTDDVFTAALAQRVTLFQADHGLKADGVVGEQTMLRLNEATGLALTPDRALQRAGWLTGAP